VVQPKKDLVYKKGGDWGKTRISSIAERLALWDPAKLRRRGGSNLGGVASTPNPKKKNPKKSWEKTKGSASGRGENGENQKYQQQQLK